MKRWLQAVSGALAAVLLLAASPVISAPRFGTPEAWRGAQRDADGDVHVIAIYRDGALAERPLKRLAARSLGTIRRSFKAIPGDVLKVRPDRLAEVLADLEADPDVLIVEADRADQHALAQDIPWGITRVGADPTSRTLSGAGDGAGVDVAVIDTGIYRSPSGDIHPDLAAAFRGGYDFVNNDAGPWDGNGHGTHVAGTIAAGDNGFGVVGVAPGVNLYALKALDDAGTGTYADFVEAIDWAIANRMRIVNYSAGGTTRSLTMEAACNRARDAGILVVVAAGNSALKSTYVPGTLLYPAAFDSVIAVGSVGPGGQRSGFSQYGGALDLVGPGEAIESTWTDGGYALESGTSMATPHVAGVAALFRGRGVTDRALLEAFLKSSAVDLGAKGWDPYYGSGLVDADAVLFGSPVITAPAADQVLATGAPAALQWEPVAGATAYKVYFASSATANFKLFKTVLATATLAVNAPFSATNRAGCRYLVAAYRDAKLIGVNTLSPFALEVVSIAAPVAGSEVVGGSLVDVQWSAGGTVRPVRKVVIQRSRDNGATWARVATLAPGATSYPWLAPVPVAASSAWRLRVRLLDAAGVAIGTGVVPFTLVPPPAL
jgi:hypothetical protein